MSGSDLGGLFGDLLVAGFMLWGVDKMSDALDSNKQKDFKFFNTEPFQDES